MSLDTWEYMDEGSGSPATYANRQYSEKINSGDISSSVGNSTVTRIFYINHAYIPDFLDDLLGYSQVGNSGLIERELPDAHPDYPNYYAMEATVKGVGLDGSALQYGNQTAKSLVAEVTAQYKSADFVVVGDQAEDNELYRFVTRTMNFSYEAFSIDSTSMKMCSNIGADGNPKALSIPPQKLIGAIELTYVWHMVPPNPDTSPFAPPNLESIKTCTGKVHEADANFDASFLDAESGTTLFLGCEPKLVAPRVTTGTFEENIFWEITMKFLYRNNGVVIRTTPSGDIDENAGHQFIWDQGNRRWDLHTHNGRISGNRLYETADLNSLFTIG